MRGGGKSERLIFGVLAKGTGHEDRGFGLNIVKQVRSVELVSGSNAH